MRRVPYLKAAVAICGLVICSGCLQLAIAADAPRPVTPRHIGVLLVSWSVDSKIVQAFRDGLREAGYVEGRDIVIEWRSAHGDYERVPALVDELVKRKVDVLVTNGTVGTRAAKRATSTIPIVMAVVADPVGSGLVDDLAHPGKNITGNTIMSPELSAKRLQLLKEVVPHASRVAVLWNQTSPYSQKVITQLKEAAPALSLELKLIGLRDPEGLGAAFAAATRARAQALYAIEDPLFDTHRVEFLGYASKARLPIVYWARTWTDDGGIVSYGPTYSDLFRGLAAYVDKILKGANPGDLPIQQPTKFELVVNPSAAKDLGMTIPEAVLLRADEIVQ